MNDICYPEISPRTSFGRDDRGGRLVEMTMKVFSPFEALPRRYFRSKMKIY